MLKFFFVRHGETLSNTIHTLQGWSDTPLTKNGIKQGHDLGKGMEDVPILKIYTSTSERAYDTACCLRGNRNIEIIMDKGLKEMNFGLKECQSNRFKGCQCYHDLVFYPWDEFDGENLDILTDRMTNTLKRLVNENKNLNGNIICVSHGLAILSCIRAIDIEKFNYCMDNDVRFDNCSVTTFIHDNNKFTVDAINDMKYVRSGEMK